MSFLPKTSDCGGNQQIDLIHRSATIELPNRVQDCFMNSSLTLPRVFWSLAFFMAIFWLVLAIMNF